jgi:hypothetical protein
MFIDLFICFEIVRLSKMIYIMIYIYTQTYIYILCLRYTDLQIPHVVVDIYIHRFVWVVYSHDLCFFCARSMCGVS